MTSETIWKPPTLERVEQRMWDGSTYRAWRVWHPEYESPRFFQFKADAETYANTQPKPA